MVIKDRDLNDYKLLDRYYLSDPNNVEKALQDTSMSLEELTSIVGIFGKNSSREGLMRGQVLKYLDGRVEIRHHFSKKILWTKD